MAISKVRHLLITLLTGEKAWAVYICGMFLLSPPTIFATALTVPPAARETAENVKNEARNINVADKEEGKVKKDLENTEEEAASLEKAKDSKEIDVERAKKAADELEALAQSAEADEASVKAEIAAANEAIERARVNVQKAEAEVEAISDREAKANQAFIEAESNIMFRDDEIVMAGEQYDAAKAALREALIRFDRSVTALEGAEDRLAAAGKKLEAIEEARARAKEAKEVAGAEQSELEDMEKRLNIARDDIRAAKSARLDLQTPDDPSKRLWRYFSTDSKFYNWKDNNGNSGYQFYQPFTFGYVQGNMEYSLSTGYVISNNKSFADGKVSTFTDTDLGVAYTAQNGRHNVVYSLTTNIPTGRESLNGTNAIMSDDLVQFSRFGEGWNFTPGVLFSWKIGKEDTWAVGTYYSFNGSYTLDQNNPDSSINPGNGWSKLLRWKHAGQKWQFVGELAHGGFGSSRDGNISYKQGNQFDVNLTYNRVLSDDQDLMFYYWRTNEQPYMSDYPGFDTGRSTTTNYFGTMWSKELNDKNTFRIMFDVMKRAGSIYNPVTYLTNRERQRYAFGLGYDFKFFPGEKLSFDIESFRMTDDDSNNSKYRGYNFYVRYFKYM